MQTQNTAASLVKVQQFVLLPAKRESIANGLDEKSCLEFISNIAEVTEGLSSDIELDLPELCIPWRTCADAVG